jgi:hypothetical protein
MSGEKRSLTSGLREDRLSFILLLLFYETIIAYSIHGHS